MEQPIRSPHATRKTALGFVLVSLLHLYILSAGGAWPLPSYSAYYNRQADAFAAGQTHLLLKPVPGLLALPDPYDPDANRPYRKTAGVHDAVLHDGKFYLYWGPLPGLLLVPAKAVTKAITGHSLIIGDEWLVLAFSLGTTLAVSLLLRLLYVRHFADRPAGYITLGTVLFGLATPTTYFLARPAVYEAAIIGGQCFLIFGIYFLACAFRPCDGVSQRWLFVGGSALAAAVACRVSLAIGVIAIAGMVTVALLWQAFRTARAMARVPQVGGTPQTCAADGPTAHSSPEYRRPVAPATCLKSLASFALPLMVMAAALLAYNQVRFGTPLEFGQKYQLTGANYKATPALFSLANATPSTWSYLNRPFALVPHFPFVLARVGEGTFPDGITLPPHYESHETIVGLFPSAPVFIFALLPLLRLVRSDQPSPLRLAIALLAAGGLLGFAPVLFMVGSTHRYLTDLWPALATLAAIGCLMLHKPGRRGIPLRATLVLLVGWTLAIGLLMGHSGYYMHFKSWNGAWYETLGGR